MTPRDHERFRRQLEKELRADVELIYASYCAKLRAYERLHELHGDLDAGFLPPAEPTLSLPAAAVPAAPPEAPAPKPPPPPKLGPNELYNAVVAALGKLPEYFIRSQVHAVLGFTPPRASLYGVFRQLETAGWLVKEEYGEGRLANVYRQRHFAAMQAADSTAEDPTESPDGSGTGGETQ
jgi:hypothetical protein